MKFKLLAPMLIVPVLAAIFFGSQRSKAQSAPHRIEIVAKRFDFNPGSQFRRIFPLDRAHFSRQF